PSEAELRHRLLGHDHPADRPDPLHLRLEFACAQIQMQPVLSRLRILHPLQQQLQAGSAFGEKTQILPDDRALLPVAKNLTPERSRALQVRAVNDEYHLAAEVPLMTVSHRHMIADPDIRPAPEADPAALGGP